MAEDKPGLDRKDPRAQARELNDFLRKPMFEPIKLFEPKTNLGKVFGKIPGAPVKKDNPYYTDGERLTIFSRTPEQYKELEILEPFFVLNNTWEVNKNVVPYVWNDSLNKSQRFIEAEKYTNGDSGLFAVCAVSSPDPDTQARLYDTITDHLLAVHKNNPNLLVEWMEKQMEPQKNGVSSFNVFYSFDHINKGGEIKLRPQEDLLVAFEPEEFEKVWQERIAELGKAETRDNLQPHHFRWIEFLSHSVNTSKLLWEQTRH